MGSAVTKIKLKEKKVDEIILLTLKVTFGIFKFRTAALQRKETVRVDRKMCGEALQRYSL